MPAASRDRGVVGTSLVAAMLAVLIGGAAAATTAVLVVNRTNESAQRGTVPAPAELTPQPVPTQQILVYGQ
jgi:cell division protein FtsN